MMINRCVAGCCQMVEVGDKILIFKFSRMEGIQTKLQVEEVTDVRETRLGDIIVDTDKYNSLREKIFLTKDEVLKKFEEAGDGDG